MLPALPHYTVLEQLGEGGMGVVYKARDTRLGRIVVIKALHAGKAALGEDRQRFLHEARVASGLTHPNIVTIHDVGEVDGCDFLVMEYVSGSTLAELIPPTGLAIDQALNFGCQIVDALCAAHEAGIVHRDLKPANVMVTPTGRLKLLDFGLAKVISIAPGLDLDATHTAVLRTVDGAIVGTIAYMSPEQVTSGPIDARSDLFSFGALFYEMLTGRRAFDQSSAVTTLTAVLRDQPCLPSRIRPGVPAGLERLIMRCLEKDPERRFSSAIELRSALDSPGYCAPGGPAQTPASIAVLPFRNLSAEPETDYFSDGLAEEILNALSRIPGLRVAARTSSFAFRNAGDIREIGERLGVETVLQGSVRRSGSRVRVSVQLVNAAQGYELWNERYDREITDVFDIQDDIALHIAGQLRVQFAPAQVPRGASPEAYDLYLRGRHQMQRYSPSSLMHAKDCFESAIRLDRNFGPVYAAMSDYYCTLGVLGLKPALEVMPKADWAASRALELDPSLEEAHASLGLVRAAFEHRWDDAARHFREAISLSPSAPAPHNRYGVWYLNPMGRFEEAMAESRIASEFDPLCSRYAAALVFLHFTQRRYREAVQEGRQSLAADPANIVARFFCAWALICLGETAAAIQVCNEGLLTEPGNAWLTFGLLFANAGAGRAVEARSLLAQLEAQRTVRYLQPGFFATAYAYLNDPEPLFSEIARAMAERDPAIVAIPFFEVFNPYRHDPRFNRLLTQLSLPTHPANRSQNA